MPLRWCTAVLLGAIWCVAAPAHADPRADIAARTRAAMASYDALDYDAARRLLNQALAIAKRARLDRDPIVARVYLDLGIAQLASSDVEAARVAFLSAVQIDPKIAIDPAYKSAELVRLLEEARAAAADSGEPVSEDCKAVRGLQLTPIEGARRGVAQPIEVRVATDLAPARVVVMYRPEGAIDFTELRLGQKSSCRYAGTIPAAAMRGSVVHFYVAAYDAGNKVLAAKGSSAAPGVIDLASGGAAHRAVAGAEGDAPDASGASGVSDGSPEPAARLGVVGREPRAAHGARIELAVSAGTGIGYVSGKTEADNVVQKCCVGMSPVVLSGELRYWIRPKLSLGAVARFGLPLGANIAGHSTIAPAGFVRVGYALSPSRDGLHVMAELGFGILRNTIQLGTDTPGMDVDVVAQGPLLLGAGAGYAHHLGRTVAVFGELDAVAGIAIIDQLGSAVHLNTGIGADLQVGLAFGF
ncbi:MAG TPA: tetratricopeptide repeat protein [Kofleriaceae bacterium]|nr:tetratricopeptide repeat protein [Kofleriaceae bacterium]